MLIPIFSAKITHTCMFTLFMPCKVSVQIEHGIALITFKCLTSMFRFFVSFQVFILSIHSIAFITVIFISINSMLGLLVSI